LQTYHLQAATRAAAQIIIASRAVTGSELHITMYNNVMDVDGVKIVCPACGSRLVILPRVQYIACRHCGSEYTVNRRGNSIGLEPFSPEQFELSRQIADVENVQAEGCSNVFFWILLVSGVLFCGLGFLSRALFQSSWIFIAGWAISLIVLVAAGGVMLRMLNAQREVRLELEARQRTLYEQMATDNEAEGE
jgi:DNA-directed RNA polymerase subunit RPC12/RpoP